MTQMTDLIHSIDTFSDTAINIRRALHMHPELGFEEYETTKKIISELSNQGISGIPFPQTTGLYVELPSSAPAAKSVLLRADIDALPIQDEKDAAYRSRREGVMHACGHDVHTTVLISALQALKQAEVPLPLGVRGVFQPAEELGKGALSLIEQGVLKDIDYAVSLHVDPMIPFGSIAVKPGPINAGITSFTITFRGASAHGARPYLGVDAVQLAAQFITTAYAKVPRSVDSRDPMVLHFGTIQGGRSMNALADSCTITGAIRTLKNEVMKDAVEELRKVGEATVMMFGGGFDFRIDTQMSPVVNDPFVSDAMYRAACEVVGRNQVITDLPTSMGAEDFGAFMQHVPGAMFRLGVADIKENAHMLHTSLFDVQEEAIAIGAKVMALTVFELNKGRDE